MQRRHLLALVGSLAAGGGCTGFGAEPSVDATVTPAPVPTQSDGRTDTAPPAGDAEIRGATVQPGVVRPGIDSIYVEDDAGQYLVVEVAGDAPDRSDIEFRFSGATYLPREFGRPLYRDDGDVAAYGERGGLVVFALPETGDGTDAELFWGDGSWAPPTAVVERLEDPQPPFAVSMTGPATAAPGSDPRLTVTVRNEGEGAGRYVLALNRQGPRVAYVPVTRLTGSLSPGATATHTVDAVPPEGENSTQYTLDVPGSADDPRHTIAPAE